jgi:two-component system, NtrC family, response regulator GlrR
MDNPLCIVFRDLHPELGWAAQFEDALDSTAGLRPHLQFVHGFPNQTETVKPADVRAVTVCQSQFPSGISAVETLRRKDSSTPFLIVTDALQREAIARLFAAGASDFLSPPLRQPEVFGRLLRLTLGRPKPSESASKSPALNGIIGHSASILKEISRVQDYANCDTTVLIDGETGTGKEMFARAIHDSGPRVTRAFVPINCAAIPLDLFENELFGHEAGAFTGARGRSQGMLGEAEGGTIFLDEIECLPLAIQAKFLRFLQDGCYRALGSAKYRQGNVRVISASNRELGHMVARGEFRQDLLYRLNVLPLHLPPLRARRQDIPVLIEHLLLKHSSRLHRSPARLSSSALDKLMAHNWPGNVRELENVLQRALILNRGDLIEEIFLDGADPSLPLFPQSFGAQKARVVAEFEKQYLQDALARCDGNISQAARLSGKDRRSFFELLRKHKIVRPAACNAPRPSPDLRVGRGAEAAA